MKYNQGLQWEVKDENGVAIPLEGTSVFAQVFTTFKQLSASYLIPFGPKNFYSIENAMRCLLLCGFASYYCFVELYHLKLLLLMVSHAFHSCALFSLDKLKRPPLKVPFTGEGFKWIHYLKQPGFHVLFNMLTNEGYFEFARKILNCLGIILQLPSPESDHFILSFHNTFSAHVYIHLSKKVEADLSSTAF